MKFRLTWQYGMFRIEESHDGGLVWYVRSSHGDINEAFKAYPTYLRETEPIIIAMS
jgi:hypothetical protein